MRLNLRRSAILMAVALAMVIPGTALARHTTLVEIYEINTTNWVCGGTVLQTVSGRIQSIAHFDSADDLLAVTNVFPDYKVTYSNPAAGISITSVRGAMERRTVESGLGYVRVSAGLFGELILPGTGKIAMNTGLLVVTFDSNGDLADISVTPTRDGPIADFVCPYLI